MKKTTTTGWMLFALTLLAASPVFIGCSSDKDIDLGDIDKTIGIGSDDFTLPTSSTKDSPLGDLLDIKDGDVIDTLKADSAGYKTGDYQFVKGDTIKTANPKVKEVKFKEPNITPKEFTFTLPKEFIDQKGNDYHLYFPSEDDAEQITHFSFTGDPNDQVISLNEADVDGNVTLTVHLEELNGKVTLAQIDIYLPKFLNADESKFSELGYETEKNLAAPYDDFWKLTLKNVPTNAKKDIPLKLNRLTNFSTEKDPSWTSDDSYLVFNENGPELNGVIKMRMMLNSKDIAENYTTTDEEFTISTDADFGEDITIVHAEGYFDPNITLDPSNINLGDDVPDFLTDDRVKIYMYNPCIKLEITNNINVEAFIDGTLTAVYKDKNGNINGKKRLEVNGITMKQAPLGEELTSTIVLCRQAPATSDGKVQYIQLNSLAETMSNDTLVVGDIAKILNRIPDNIEFNFNAKANTTKLGKIDLYAEGTENDHTAHGCGYEVKPEYRFTAPLELENGSVIVYSDTISDWNKDLVDNEIDFYGDAYILMEANIKNSTPLQMVIDSPTPIGVKDADGNVPQAREVTVQIVDANGNPKNGGIIVDNGKTEKLYLKIGGALKTLDGIVLEVEARSDMTAPEVLNASKHRVQLNDVTLHINGRMTIALDSK